MQKWKYVLNRQVLFKQVWRTFSLASIRFPGDLVKSLKISFCRVHKMLNCNIVSLGTIFLLLKKKNQNFVSRDPQKSCLRNICD